jgi:hypothetical protein
LVCSTKPRILLWRPRGEDVKGADKPKQLAKKAPQKSLKQKRAEKKAKKRASGY